jgi:hypothetical protein
MRNSLKILLNASRREGLRSSKDIRDYYIIALTLS